MMTVAVDKKERIERRKNRAAQHKYELAGKLDSNEMLVSAFRFYVAELRPKERVDGEPVIAKWRDCTRRMKRHLKAARLVLGIQWPEKDQMVLPGNYRERLLMYTGLDLLLGEMADAAAFEALPSDLTVDDAMKEFALQHPEILERTKAFLRGDYSPWLPAELSAAALRTGKEEQYPNDPVSTLVSNHLASSFHKLFK